MDKILKMNQNGIKLPLCSPDEVTSIEESMKKSGNMASKLSSVSECKANRMASTVSTVSECSEFSTCH